MGKIVIFGANGFIGRHLVHNLSHFRPDDEIYAFDRYSSLKTGSGHTFDNYPNVTIVAGDFFNRDDVASVLDNADYAFHLVSTTNPAASNNDPFIDIDTNVRGSIELFQLCSEAGVKKLIFLSSGGSVYGNIDSNTLSEDTVPVPISPYGIGKLTIEHYLRYFKHTHDLDYVIYRVANPYGPGQNIHGKQGVIPIFMGLAINHEPITVFGDGEMLRDYIYIDDLVAMIATSFDKQNQFDTYNVGSGEGTSVNQIISAIEECTHQTIEKVHKATPSTYVKSSVLNIDRFSGEYSIKPTVTLQEGIRKTWDYVKSIEK